MLLSEVPRLTTDSPLRVFLGVWKLFFFFLRLHPRMDFCPSLFCLSFYLLYFFLYLLSKTMVCLSGCLMSSASIQKLFCGICSVFECSFNEFVGGKVVSPSYASAILGPPCPWDFQDRILEWAAISYSRGSPLSQDQTQVSCRRGRFFTI